MVGMWLLLPVPSLLRVSFTVAVLMASRDNEGEGQARRRMVPGESLEYRVKEMHLLVE